ncbi:hypothetical protein Dimus_006078, partial [Dionaea muscipula]
FHFSLAKRKNPSHLLSISGNLNLDDRGAVASRWAYEVAVCLGQTVTALKCSTNGEGTRNPTIWVANRTRNFCSTLQF